eukprot:5217402-Prymnesium_polylepis.1
MIGAQPGRGAVRHRCPELRAYDREESQRSRRPIGTYAQLSAQQSCSSCSGLRGSSRSASAYYRHSAAAESAWSVRYTERPPPAAPLFADVLADWEAEAGLPDWPEADWEAVTDDLLRGLSRRSGAPTPQTDGSAGTAYTRPAATGHSPPAARPQGGNCRAAPPC